MNTLLQLMDADAGRDGRLVAMKTFTIYNEFRKSGCGNGFAHSAEKISRRGGDDDEESEIRNILQKCAPEKLHDLLCELYQAVPESVREDKNIDVMLAELSGQICAEPQQVDGEHGETDSLYRAYVDKSPLRSLSLTARSTTCG